MSFHDVDSDGEDSERSSSGWLGGIADVAHCLTENVKPVVSGVASFVHQAAVAVASEIAQLEQEGEFDHSSAENFNMQQSSPDQSADQEVPKKLILPWEISTEEEDIPGYVTDNDLKDAILTLSDQESTFVEPFQDQSDNPDAKSFADCDDIDPKGGDMCSRVSLKSFSSTFAIDAPRIDLIRRLMDIDKNLASAHSRFSGE